MATQTLEVKKTKSQASAVVFTVLSLSIFTVALIIPSLRSGLIYYSSSSPFIMGFIKFSVLATAGELLAEKIKTGAMFLTISTLYKALVWGVLGVIITLMMSLFISGTTAMMTTGYLPFKENAFAKAFFSSTIMNLTFGIVFMAAHRITDKIIELWVLGKGLTSFTNAAKLCNWSNFVPFVIGKTIFFFWIPAHTLTIMLPSEYRVLAAAALSVALGIILAVSSKK